MVAKPKLKNKSIYITYLHTPPYPPNHTRHEQGRIVVPADKYCDRLHHQNSANIFYS